MVTWSAPDHDGGREISGYYVEKREKKGIRWSPCNTKPITDRRYEIKNNINSDNASPNHSLFVSID